MALTPTPISLNEKDFWNKIKNSITGNRIGFFKAATKNGGFVYLVALNDSAKMTPFVRTAEELFETTVLRESAAKKLSVVINGPTYGLTYSGKVDALMGSDPVPATETLQEGKIVYKKAIIAGSASDMYYIANTPTERSKYKFGRGNAPTDVEAAIGNMGPLIINNLPFGSVNTYSPPQPGARKKGQPAKKYQNYLTQRSNARFTANVGLPDSVGKVVIGHSLINSTVLILLQPHGTLGLSISGLRDILVNLGLESAVYLDGSDSVMLMLNNSFVVRAASNKNETNITGIGFKY